MSLDGEPRILSIQSHVVRGCVGNRAGVFPLQLLGFEVDIVNSVQFASMFIHEGHTLSGEDLRSLLAGVVKAQAQPRGGGHPGAEVIELSGQIKSDYSHVLTGFVGNPGFLLELVSFMRSQKASLSSDDAQRVPLWICDPVMGDNGRLYVPEKVVDVYRTNVLPLADLITPNHYELQWLCNAEPVAMFENLQQIVHLCSKLHARGPCMVVVTSAPVVSDPSTLFLVGSQRTQLDDGTSWSDNAFYIPFPRRSEYLGGTGDLMAAMILACLERSANNLQSACESALATVQSVMKVTLDASPAAHEINVVKAQKGIVSPDLVFHACKLSPGLHR